MNYIRRLNLWKIKSIAVYGWIQSDKTQVLSTAKYSMYTDLGMEKNTQNLL